MIKALPTQKTQVKNYNPNFLLLFGKPKSGKSSLMASLESNLILDLENGYQSLSVLKVDIKKASDIFDVAKLIREKIEKDGKQPYKFITVDNATRLSELALPYAAHLYRSTPMGSGWGWLKDPKNPILPLKDEKGKNIPDPKADVTTLPNGAGYLYLRKAIRELIDSLKGLSETLILIGHVKDKQIQKDGQEMNEMSIDLAGKLGDIICGEADAIGYIYREGNKTIISFEGGDNVIKEARPLHLRGKKFVVATSDKDNNLTFDLSKIFV